MQIKVSFRIYTHVVEKNILSHNFSRYQFVKYGAVILLTAV